MEKELELRKEKIIKFIQEKKDWMQYIILFFILWLAFHVRSQNWNLLKDITTGKYISLEVDSALFMRYAQYIAEHGRLFAVDTLRNYPLGVPIDFGVFTSYFVAYLYKILYFFNSNITVEFADVIYPTVATMVATMFLFLFVRRLFDYRVALLSALFLVVAPTFIFRSISSDHDILGLMFIFMTLYFFTVAWQAKKIKYNIVFAVLSAFSTILAYNTAGNIRIFFMFVALFILVHILLDNVKKNDMYIYPIWYLLSFPVLLISGKMPLSLFLSDYTSTLPATFAFLALVCYLMLDIKHVKNHSFYNKLLTKIPKGVIAFIVVTIITLISLAAIFGIDFIVNTVKSLIGLFFGSYLNSRWASTVSENRRMLVGDWFSSFGTVMVWLFIIGLILIVYKLVKGMKDYKKLFYVYSVCLLAFIFSRYSTNSVLNGQSGLSKFLFYGSLFVFISYTGYYYIKNYYEAGKSSDRFAIELNWKYTLILIIAMINVVAGVTTVRLFFELSPFIVIISSFALICILDYFLSVKTVFLKYLGVTLIILLLFSPFSFAKGIVIKDAKSSFDQVKFSGPSYNQQWQVAGKWVRENTPKDAVFNHWWDYGYWVQEGFERATATDGGNRIGWWNYLTGRNVLTAPKDEDALGFLYSHNVSYFLIVNEEIGKYPAYSLIGSDHNLDRYSYIPFFGLDPSKSQDTRNGTLLVYAGAFGLDEDLILNNKVYGGGTPLVGVLVPLDKILGNNDTVTGYNVKQPSIVLIDQSQVIQLSIKCVYLDKLYTFENYDYGGCIRVIPTIEGDKMNNVGAAIVMSRRVADSLFARLYLQEQESKYFKLVYNDAGSIPLAIYNGRQIGPTKIWELEYPEGFSVNETEYGYYTRVNYPDITLTEF